MSNPFLSITVQPAYGRAEALLTWRLAQEYETGDVYVFKSYTGIAPWTLLNDKPVRKATVFRDSEVYVQDKSQSPFYRLLLEHEGQRYGSNVIGLYDKLSLREYAGVRKMMAAELRRMRGGNGVAVWHYIPLTDGDPNPAFDLSTQQQLGMECAFSAEQSYGLPFKGGYGPPVWTYIEKGQVLKIVKERDDGTGSEELVETPARMLAFPQPSRGHLLVHPALDERWVVGEEVTPYAFKGLVPVAYGVKLHLLRRTDPRYRVPTPS